MFSGLTTAGTRAKSNKTLKASVTPSEHKQKCKEQDEELTGRTEESNSRRRDKERSPNVGCKLLDYYNCICFARNFVAMLQVLDFYLRIVLEAVWFVLCLAYGMVVAIVRVYDRVSNPSCGYWVGRPYVLRCIC